MKLSPIGKPQKRISEGFWQRNSHVKRWGKKWPNWKIPKLIVHKKRVKDLVGKETMVLCCRGKKSEEATSAYISFYFSNLYDYINSFNWHKFLFTDYGRKHLEYLRSSYETGPNAILVRCCSFSGRKFSENCQFCFKDGTCKRRQSLNNYFHVSIETRWYQIIKLLRSTLSLGYNGEFYKSSGLYCWLILGIFFCVIYKDLINAPDDISNCKAILLFCRVRLSDLRPHGT